MIKPWLFEFFHQPLDIESRSDPHAVHEHFRWYVDLWTRADSRAFEGIFFSEHHFGAAYSPSPNLLVAHVAARTTRLRLGVLGSVTPYATPWRIVEEIAMLDHLTDGRLEIGVVSGIPPELAVVGITGEVAAARHTEILDVLEAALKSPVVSHHGTHWSFDDLEILPRCLQQPSPPMWTAVRTAASAEKAGRRGWKACGGFLSAKEVGEVFDAYRLGAEEAGNAHGPEQIAVRRMVTFVDKPSQQRDAVHRAKRALLDVLTASAGPLPPWAALLDRPDESIAALSDEEFVSGTPRQVAEQLIEQCQIIGAGHLLVAFSERDHDRLEASHEAFSAQVAPLLRQAGVGWTRLTGKVALITGTGVGMGRAAALRFAAEGATVVGCDLNPDTSAETVRLVHAAGGTMTATAPVDLSSFEATKDWVDRAADEHGGIDVLYNNASLPVVGPWDDLTVDQWHAGIRNELDLVFYACKVAWPHLVARGGGSIINVASIASIRGAAFFQQAAHGAAKGGVLSFTYHLAAAGGPHRIRANAIMPGLIRTPSTEFLFAAADAPGSMLAAANPLGRVGEADDVAKLAAFLASDDAWYINAAAIPVDGGQSVIE